MFISQNISFNIIMEHIISIILGLLIAYLFYIFQIKKNVIIINGSSIDKIKKNNKCYKVKCQKNN